MVPMLIQHTKLLRLIISHLGISHDDLISTGNRYISGVLCGTSAIGRTISGKEEILSGVKDTLFGFKDSVLLNAVAMFTDLETPNDGMVWLESCKVKGTFGSSYNQPYYQKAINHAEGTCRRGEPIFPKCFPNPCRWYKRMHVYNAVPKLCPNCYFSYIVYVFCTFYFFFIFPASLNLHSYEKLSTISALKK